MLKFLLSLIVLCLLGLSSVYAATLVWDRNPEPDMKQYHVYVCKTAGCTETGSGLDWIATVPHPAVGVIPSHVLPDNVHGGVAVIAENLAGLMSGVSVTLPFTTVQALPPGPPKNLRLQ